MPTNTNIPIPPAHNVTVPAGTISFPASSNCNVCFGTANPAGSFPGLENNGWPCTAGLTYGPYPAATVGASLPYNTSDPGTDCSLDKITEAVSTIHVGSGFGSAEAKTKAKTAGKAKAKPKKKAKLVSKAKPAPKTKAKPKSASKTQKAKPKAKAKTKAKAKPKPKKGSKSKR
ncbi:MAG: hypothetical protein ABSD98_11215 [Candidatus Korobacteraceae bacterium]|jgi:hypothetical protein